MPRPRINPNAPALTGAERQRRYRAKRRAAGLIETWTRKDTPKVQVPDDPVSNVYNDLEDWSKALPGEFRHRDDVTEPDDEQDCSIDPRSRSKHLH